MSEMGQGFVGSNPVAEIDYSLSLRKFQAIVLGIDRVRLLANWFFSISIMTDRNNAI